MGSFESLVSTISIPTLINYRSKLWLINLKAMKVLRHSFESGERRSTSKSAVIVNHLVLKCSMSSRRGTERQFKAIPGCNGNFKFHPTSNWLVRCGWWWFPLLSSMIHRIISSLIILLCRHRTSNQYLRANRAMSCPIWFWNFTLPTIVEPWRLDFVKMDIWDI